MIILLVVLFLPLAPACTLDEATYCSILSRILPYEFDECVDRFSTRYKGAFCLKEEGGDRLVPETCTGVKELSDRFIICAANMAKLEPKWQNFGPKSSDL